MIEQEQLRELINNKPKHFVRLITNYPALLDWVEKNSIVENGSLVEKIYSALNNESFICQYNNRMKFNTINTNPKFCGRANSCQCAKESVSKSVSATKSTASAADIQSSNLKRSETNHARYGVTNSAQTKKARLAHSNFYKSADLVERTLSKMQATMIHNHGVPNPQQVESIKLKSKQTLLQNLGVDNPMKDVAIKKKSIETRLENYDPKIAFNRNYEKLKNFIHIDLNLELLTPQEDYHGVASRPLLEFKCLTCGFEFDKRFDYAVLPNCIQCNPSLKKYVSNEEMELFDYIVSIYNGLVIQSDRTKINPYQLDILLPNLNLAFEYCGLYWHSEISGNKQWNYHAKKTDLANSKGIRLITIFSDEWVHKKEIVKQKIKHILNAEQEKIGARQCIVKQVDLSTAKEFYDQFHIQGKRRNLGITLGLFKNDDLLAAMSFVKIQNADNAYDICRYATSKPVIGGASKLLRYFCRSYEWNSIISFADRRWSDGDLYKKLGFNQISQVPPMQTYVENYSKRHHKLLFNKAKLQSMESYDASLTEWQNLRNNSYDRIWDCGKIKFELTKNSIQ